MKVQPNALHLQHIVMGNPMRIPHYGSTVQATLWISFTDYYGFRYSAPYSPDSCGTMLKSKFTVYLQTELITHCDKMSGDNRQTQCNLRLDQCLGIADQSP